MPEKMIYLVTTLQFADATRNSRCVGFYFDLEDANRLVFNNGMDIAEEGYYRYAVIEEKGEGTYRMVSNEWWFKFDRGVNQYVRCSKPEKLHNVCCFGIG
jgi:hypothetical protein